MFLDHIELQDTKTRNRTRKGILKASFNLFCLKGIGRISMVEISQEADITRRTLYNYYDEKEQIAIDIYLFMTDYILKKLKEKAGIDPEAITLDTLKNYFLSLYHITIDDPRILHYLVRFDQFAYEHTQKVDQKILLDNRLIEAGDLKRIIQHLREIKVFPGFVKDIDMLVQAVIQSIIGYLERVCFRIRSLQMEGHLADDHFFDLIETIVFQPQIKEVNHGH